MEKIDLIIYNLKRSLIQPIAQLDEWFDFDPKLLRYKPPDGGWCAAEVLEHVMLTNHYLLILINKASRKALNFQVSDDHLVSMLSKYRFESDRLEDVSHPDAFIWSRPDHMNPTGLKDVEEIRFEIRAQLNSCLQQLELLKNGEGILYHTMMSVNNLGRLDVYQYIYFLAMHAKRHLVQLRKIQSAYLESLKYSLEDEWNS